MKLVKQKVYCDFPGETSVSCKLHTACRDQSLDWFKLSFSITGEMSFFDYLLDFIDIYNLDRSDSFDDPF